MKKQYRSCFVGDVSIDYDTNLAVLTDSARNRFNVDLSDENIRKNFNDWFNSVFCKGIAHTLTIFEYITKPISECEDEIYVLNFKNVKNNFV